MSSQRIKYVFNGRVDKGKLILKERDAFFDKVQNLNGKQIALTIEESKKLRSLPQNNYYWGVVLEIISEHTGHTALEIHEIMKQKFLKPREINIKGEHYFVHGSTTNLDQLGMMDYIERIKAWAATALQLSIPEPYTVDL
jgi:hypothetical protein